MVIWHSEKGLGDTIPCDHHLPRWWYLHAMGFRRGSSAECRGSQASLGSSGEHPPSSVFRWFAHDTSSATPGVPGVPSSAMDPILILLLLLWAQRRSFLFIQSQPLDSFSALERDLMTAEALKLVRKPTEVFVYCFPCSLLLGFWPSDQRPSSLDLLLCSGLWYAGLVNLFSVWLCLLLCERVVDVLQTVGFVLKVRKYVDLVWSNSKLEQSLTDH